MGFRSALGIVVATAAVTALVPSGVAVGTEAAPVPVLSPTPRLSASFVNDSAKRTARVVVQYSVSDGPTRYRTVLQCQESTDGSFERVATSLLPSGTLIDVEPGDRNGKYRVVMEGARGFVLASVDLGKAN